MENLSLEGINYKISLFLLLLSPDIAENDIN